MKLKHKRRNKTEEISIEEYYEGEIFHFNPRPKKNKIPIFYVPGFTSSPKMAIKTIKKIGKQTRREVISYFPAPGSLTSKDPVVSKWEPMQIHNGVELISAILKSGHDLVDIVGHSQGALSAILAAEMKPLLFRSMILVAPAGFVENDSPFSMVKRMIRNLLQYRGLYKKGNTQLKNIYNSTLSYLLRFKVKAFKEGLSLADQKITQEDLQRITNNGIKIALILSNDDKIFPYELMTNTLPDNLKIDISEDRELHQTIHSSLLFDDEIIDSIIANLKGF